MRFLTGRGKTGAKTAGKTAPTRRPRRRIDLRGWRGKALAGAGAVLVIGSLGLWAQHSGRLEVWGSRLADDGISLSARLGLVVADIDVDGRAMTAKAAILRAVGAGRGTPIFAVSPSQVKAQLETLPWVRSAAVARQLPETIHVTIVERTPFAFWQRQGKLALVDRDGTVITDQGLDRFPGLVVLVGDDAPQNAAALLELVAGEPTIAKRVVAAVRVGGRRWKLHLDNGIDVELPEENPAAAWKQLAALERDSQVLARNIEVIDMRLPDRLVVRTVPEPAKEPVKKGRPAAKST
ncbi:MAG: ftsQ [Rhodospirillales bacterium]|nr:ftsQ [Rhodospirillales bacterium]